MKAHGESDKLAAGWSRSEDGYMIPPGWVRVGGGPSPEPSENSDSMCKS